MNNEKATTNWKYCAVGNIKKTHLDESGVLRYGTAAYPGGSKVYLCGKYWNKSQDTITVIGLNRRGRKYRVEHIPVSLIENIRRKQVYKPKVLKIMENFEFKDDWWGNSSEDRESVNAFIERWRS